MQVAAASALWFLPFALPVCLYVAWTDLSRMRIPNHAVIVLALIFVVIGPLALPLAEYPWRFVHLGVVLLAGIVLNAAGLVGAGDAKFAAAAAPFIHAGDLRLILVIYTATLLAAFSAHRLAKHTPLRRLAPEWESWDRKGDFPMGLALGGSLGLYLLLGAFLGG